MIPIELTVIVKGDTEEGDDSSYRQKFLIHDEFIFTDSDPIVKQLIETTLKNAKITPDSIKVKASMEVK